MTHNTVAEKRNFKVERSSTHSKFYSLIINVIFIEDNANIFLFMMARMTTWLDWTFCFQIKCVVTSYDTALQVKRLLMYKYHATVAMPPILCLTLATAESPFEAVTISLLIVFPAIIALTHYLPQLREKTLRDAIEIICNVPKFLEWCLEK